MSEAALAALSRDLERHLERVHDERPECDVCHASSWRHGYADALRDVIRALDSVRS